MRTCFLSLLLLFTIHAHAQRVDVNAMQPDSVYENICNKMIYSDSLSSTFVIWVKHNVPKHKHAEHTEQVYVLEGHAQMLIGESWITVSPGDHIFIPMGTPHAATVAEGEILKVVSIQSPKFDGTDRIKLE